MHLWLLRHGDALRPPGSTDADRPLSPLGRTQARRIGSFLSRAQHHPAVILTSPFKRAVQTATIVSASCGGSRPEPTEALLSGAAQYDLLHLLHSRKEQSLLLVGHEPLMSSFTSMLIAGHASSVVHFSPCTLALITFSGRARPDGATLELLVPPAPLGRSRSPSSEERP